MQDSIFTKIIKGQLPCHKLYEDNHTIAFMDIYPVQPGHVLVVSKTQVENFFELDDNEYKAFFATVKKVAERLRIVFPEKKRIGLQIEGLDVPHVHAKLFPINNADEYRAKPDMSADPDHNTLRDIASKLSFE